MSLGKSPSIEAKNIDAYRVSYSSKVRSFASSIIYIKLDITGVVRDVSKNVVKKEGNFLIKPMEKFISPGLVV